MTNEYFESYDNIGVHNLMLRDGPRVEKYREAIMKSKDSFKDKIVMDVGSGTGLLSLFCAQAGAKHVYAVEACEGISELSKAIIEANNLSDRITVINGVIEEIELPDGVEKVDIIVSEWMGLYLLHESMLNSVLYARDKWLREEGLMYPSLAYLYVCPVEMESYLEKNMKYWTDFNGLNFEPIAKIYRQLLIEKPLVEEIEVSQLIDNDEKIIASFDLKTVPIRDLESIQQYNISFMAQKDCNLHGFAFWFDVIFNTDNGEQVTLKTGPDSQQTHWKQTITLLPEALNSFIRNKYASVPGGGLALKEGDEFESYVILNQLDDNTRCYEIDIGVCLKDENGNTIDDQKGWYEGVDQEEGEDEESDEEECPRPCDCGQMKCLIIKTAMEKYQAEAEIDRQNEEMKTK